MSRIELEENLRYATREEAMARSKGWAVADDWLTLIRSLETQIEMEKEGG